MVATRSKTLRLWHLKLYLFLSASALNVFLAIIIIANSLSIRYFLYTAPMVIQIDSLPPNWLVLLWVGSLYVLYTTKEVNIENQNSCRINYTLDAALIGSLFLIVSVVLASAYFSSSPSATLLLNQLSSWTSIIGFILSFGGIFLALFMMMTQKGSPMRLFMIYLFSLFIPIEILALMHWVAYPFDVIGNLGFAWYGAFLELQLSYIVYPLISWMLIALLFSWIWVPLLKRVVEKTSVQRWVRLKVLSLVSSSSSAVADQAIGKVGSNQENLTNRKFPVGRLLPTLILLSSLIVGVFIAYYPYISGKPGLIGTDSLGYYYTLTALDEKDLFGAAQLAYEINSARVLYHLILFALTGVSQLPAVNVIEFMPALTIVVNALAVFWFVKTTERNALLASIAAVFSIFSFTTTISMHAGTLANWLAIPLGFVTFGLVLKLLKKPTAKLFLAVTITLISLFLVHYWTGLFFVAVLISYLALELLKERPISVKLVFAGVILVLVALITVFFNDIFSRLLIPYGISNVFTESVNPVEMIGLFWMRLPILIDSWFLGALANPILIGLGLVGAIMCFYRKNRLSRLLISWTIVGSLLTILVSPIGADMSQWLLWRTLYLVPFQVQAAIGFWFVSSKLASLGQNGSDFKQHYKSLCGLKSQNGFKRNQNFMIILYISTDFVISAFLGLNVPTLLSLILLNYLILTLIIYLKTKPTEHNLVLVFIFNLLIVLVLFNCTLRSLAPLTVHRFLP
jgi:hypothetical protein